MQTPNIQGAQSQAPQNEAASIFQQEQQAQPATDPQFEQPAQAQLGKPAAASMKPEFAPSSEGMESSQRSGQYQPSPNPPSSQELPNKKGKGRIIVPAIIAVIVVVVAIISISGSNNSEKPPTSGNAQSSEQASAKDAPSAIQDAASLADELADFYGSQVYDTMDAWSESETMSYEEGLNYINEAFSRIETDIKVLKDNGCDDEAGTQALAAMENIRSALTYNKDLWEATRALLEIDERQTAPTFSEAADAINDTYIKLQKIDCPAYMKDVLGFELEMFPVFYKSIAYITQSGDSILNEYTGNELLAWESAKAYPYDNKDNLLISKQYAESSDMLKENAEGKTATGDTSFEIDVIDEIAPNLYPSLDSVVNILAISKDPKSSIYVEVEIPGFSQKFSQKYDLAQGVNYIMVKPAQLPSDKLTNLENSSDASINITITDDDSKTLDKKSQNIKLLSKYDFRWTNDQFGTTAAFDVLAWLRPQSNQVTTINRDAAAILGKWTNGSISSIAGYQFGEDPAATLMQVAAVQAAISNAGVLYTMDAYSFDANQAILTPDQVIEQKHGLCIETSLLMASCLMSAGMHPLIIIIPGHAQVAVETYEGSGNYYLIETTLLPYTGINMDGMDGGTITKHATFTNGLVPYYSKDGKIQAKTISGDSTEWETYFASVSDDSQNQGGVFVVDCNLQQVMGIQGMENI